MNSTNAQIKYPCDWVYKVIGINAELMKTAICSIINGSNFSIEQSRESRTGKYISLNVKLVVSSEDERKKYYELLGKHKDIRFVL